MIAILSFIAGAVVGFIAGVKNIKKIEAVKEALK